MIRPLRAVHHVAWMGLAVVLPAVIAAALIARHPVPPESSSAALSGPTQSSRLGTVYIRREGDVLLVVAASRFEYPDPLAYWSADAGAVSDKSEFLGSFVAGSVNRYEIASESGYLVLYTPARKMVIDSAPIGGAK